jgi:hypothetical protein
MHLFVLAAGLTGDSCHQCPVGTYSTGRSRDPCLACPFGTTSAVGSDSLTDCVPSPTACPPGMLAPPGAASAVQCTCYPGWGTTGGSSESLRHKLLEVPWQGQHQVMASDMQKT